MEQHPSLKARIHSDSTVKAGTPLKHAPWGPLGFPPKIVQRYHQLGVHSSQERKRYLESPNPVELAEVERASLNMLFFSESSTLCRPSFISLRSVWTCLLIACHTAFDARSSDVEIPEALGLTGFALCV